MKLLQSAALLVLLAHTVSAEPDWKVLAPQALADLQSYIRIPNVNPPADSRPSVAFLTGLLKKEGIPVEIFTNKPDKQTLIARLPGKHHDAPLMLLHHMDVVPADASRWPVDPFAATVKDGYLYGRGALDMKCVGMMQIYSLIALKRAGVPLEQDLILMASPDEESGGEFGTHWMVEQHWKELHPKYVLDEGGFATRDLLSSKGQPTVAISVAEKKILWVRLTATGTAGHGSQPTADNPNDRLLKVLQLIQSDPLRAGQSPVLSELRSRVGTLADNKFTRAIQADTLSITSLRSGVGEPAKVNVIPSLAQATLDFRLLPDSDEKALTARLEAACNSVPGVSMTVLHVMARAPVSSTATPLYASLEKAVQQCYPDSLVTPYLVPFGTDSNTIRLTATECYGFNPIRLDAATVATMHSDAERIPVQEFAPALACYFRAVQSYVSQP